MYLIPRLMKCKKCGHEMRASPDDHPYHLLQAGDGVEFRMFCKRCFERWLEANIGELEAK